ncbi:MAG: pilus assembly protein [Actinomycetota bacterium]
MTALAALPRRMTSRLRARISQIGYASCGAQSGSAIVEFVFLAVLMMVPLFYLVMVLGRLQAGAYGVSAAAREAGRAYVTAPVPAQAPARALAAAGLAFADQGFEQEGTIKISCDGAPCLRPDGRVRVTATVSVPMPLVPAFFSGIVPMQVPVEASHVVTVDRFGGR